MALPSTAARANRCRRRIDDIRIREHLRRTERALRDANPDLPAEKRARREQALDHLRAYWQAGAFPTNDGSVREPRFVGANGVPCAVGYLLARDGREDLVREVAREHNTVRIEALDSGPVLGWLDETGLSQEEAARIQPAYPHEVYFATTCGPLPCWLAGVLASLAGLAVGAAAEYAGYRLAGSWFPENTLKRRGALAYFTAFNLLLVPLVAALAYALFP
ncbi:hypothetical protein [Natronomonas sp. EA1]|uniref:hypothetical protein n=1 Tax=Natronomonas sp. EA1 TaxID=3421655 RepID=UPI003EB71C63